MASERLQKIIANAGISSRRHAEMLITEGKVEVNGAVVTQLGAKADPSRDHIKIDGKKIRLNSHKVYLLLNKPSGYITSAHDPEGRPTVMHLVRDVKERVYPVGRLDYESEGLLLLTNDGDLAHALMHPSMEIKKTYWAKVEGHISSAHIKKIEAGGISLPTGKTAPCKIRFLRETAQNSWIEIILHEGKNRHVHRVMEKVGHPVLKLKRVYYAFLKVANLSIGSYRHLTFSEVSGLRKLIDRPTGVAQPVKTRHIQKGG